MSWNKKKVAPGSPVDLTLTASSPSLCGIRVVDKSVTLMGGNHDTIEKDIIERKRGYYISPNASPSLINNQKYCKKGGHKLFLRKFYYFPKDYSRFI